MTNNIKRLIVETTTHCNLHCSMCVKQSATWDATHMEGSMSFELFKRLENVFPSLESLVLNGIGEPLLHPQLEDFVSFAAARMPTNSRIGFQTNGTIFNATNSLELLAAGVNTICISMDSLTDKDLEKMRGIKVVAVENAFSHLRAARQTLRKDNVRLGIEIVLKKDTITGLPQAVDWAIKHGVSFILVSQLMPYSSDMFGAVAYDTNTATAIEIYRKGISEMRRQGIGIGGYYATFMKFSKNESDMKLINIINAITDEADKQGVYLHLENLLKRDEEYFKTVNTIFAQVREPCEQHGIEISMPEAAPRNLRHCEFVEDNALFIAFNGDVHPCYFLWHRFNCYIGGVEQNIKPLPTKHFARECSNMIFPFALIVPSPFATM